MDDLFKKFINTGVGFLSQGNKAVQTAIEKLVKESKISEQEGKKIMDDLLKSGETKRAELEKQFQGLADSVKKTVGLGASKGKADAKKPASSATSKAAGATKKAADKVSDAAGSAQKSAAAKAGAAKPAAAKKPAAKKPAAASAAGAGSEGQA